VFEETKVRNSLNSFLSSLSASPDHARGHLAP
jgi:hypothetical protein